MFTRFGITSACLPIMVVITSIIALSGCSHSPASQSAPDWSANVSSFEQDIQSLQSALAVPGLGYVIVADGKVLASNAFGVAQNDKAHAFTLATPLRIASVTKSITATIALQLVEEGLLNLNQPVNFYLKTSTLSNEVLVRHLLTHTSEGKVGGEYVYSSSRYALMKDVIAAIAHRSFDEVVTERVLQRAQMKVYASPTLGAQGGLVSTIDDMAHYLVALDNGQLLKSASQSALAQPSFATNGGTLPVSLGWFAQTIQGKKVVWSFGQDDPEHSGALLIRLPEQGLSLFLLANANYVSDPFRLLMGDVSASPFAMSFLRLFAFSKPGHALVRPDFDNKESIARLAVAEANTGYRFGDEMIGAMLVDIRLGKIDEAQRKFALLDNRYPDKLIDNAIVHFAAPRLPDEQSKDKAISVGMSLLERHPDNRWILLTQGYLLQQRDRVDESIQCFEHILSLPNQQDDYLHRLFNVWSWMALAQMNMHSEPAQARRYLEQVLANGDIEDQQEEARVLLAELNARKP